MATLTVYNETSQLTDSQNCTQLPILHNKYITQFKFLKHQSHFIQKFHMHTHKNYDNIYGIAPFYN